MTYEDFIAQYPYAEDSPVCRDLWNAAITEAGTIILGEHSEDHRRLIHTLYVDPIPR